VGNFNAQNLANLVWAMGKPGQSDEPLFVAVANGAERRMDDFNE